ncbi:MAG: hypothetical protein ACFFBH_06880 [Promethearchaeota archaeon]
MGKKLRIFSVIFLILGGVAIPGGILINNYIDNLLYDNVDIGLSGIEEQFIPKAEEMILDIGPAISLPMIKENALPIIEDMIREIGPAIALQDIKELAVPANRLMVNASFLTQLLYQAYLEGLTHSMDILGYHVDGGDALLNLFFDYNDLYLGPTSMGGLGTTSFSEQLEENDLPPILGVSEWWSNVQSSEIDLEIGECSYALLGQIPRPNPNDILAWGDPAQKETDLWRNNPPGIIQHTSKGFGILDYLTNFTVSNQTGMHSEFLAQYYEGRTLDWGDFEILARYFYEYWVPVVMPILLAELQNPNSEFSARAPEYVKMTLDDISYYEFLKQWINFSTYPLGVDFHYFINEIPPRTYGLEVNSNISINSAYALWDKTNEWSFLNITGILKWFEANSSSSTRLNLASHFNLTTQQVIDICDWLWGPEGFNSHLFLMLVSTPKPYGYNTTIEDLSQRVFYELWANGTALGLSLFPEGIDFGEFIEDIPLGTTGFEVGIPTSIGLLLSQIEDLWDTSNPLSLTNITGIEKWHDAFISMETKIELQQAFQLSNSQIQSILNWLWDGPSSFSQDLLPKLLESELGYNMTLNEFAKALLLEQWANGTIMGMDMFPGGIDFHDFIPSLPPGTIGFEVGIPIPTNMSLDSALLLWDPTNSYSLVRDIQVWWNIGFKHSKSYNKTRNANFLDDKTMDMILKWLPDFKNNLMPLLAQYDMELPMDATSLGNTIQLGMIITGCAIVGIMSSILIRTTIRRRKIKK